MTEIVFGMTVPHSGMLGQPSEKWPEDGLRDRAKDKLWYRNRTWTFPEYVLAPCCTTTNERLKSEWHTRKMS